ncbi:hypothetical protein K469DRAFT_194274 [Zopfia rhizophila CBS 207.26]|uniref:Uncharacterized protein n=1 Tax=Zopfia rhizophila CBS 207.26 TaxID=1314779 RepID=A0A6A6EU16_9PEZI|nr:hypothetical protein K469DRAFT_194274 [Zopfia rhizophila CBS 207.26]
MQLHDRSLQLFIQKAISIEDRFSMFNGDGIPKLVEYHRYGEGSSILVDLGDRTRSRVEHLTQLHPPKEDPFRTLSCKGGILDVLHNQGAFIVTAPQANGTSFSLLRALCHPMQKPSLGKKSRLAHDLSRCI